MGDPGLTSVDSRRTWIRVWLRDAELGVVSYDASRIELLDDGVLYVDWGEESWSYLPSGVWLEVEGGADREGGG